MTKKPIQIKKANQQTVPFDPDKVLTSIQRTGADKKTAEAVLQKVEAQLKPLMTTKKIYDIVRKELSQHKPWAAARYNLRQAIIKLGPAGYNFEKYVAAVLAAYGYKTETPETYQGACVEHEIDVTAEKDGRIAFIEAKFRRDYSGSVNIKDTMATWARFLDLVDGSKVNLCPHFDEVWIVTNARFTDQSLKFGHCKNMKLIGWSHPTEQSFSHMVDLDALYPLTIMDTLTQSELSTFAKNDLMLCREITDIQIQALSNQTGITEERLEEILIDCRSIITGDAS
jgi:hypothetical protein